MIAEYGKKQQDILPVRIFLVVQKGQKPDGTTAVFEYGLSPADPKTTMKTLLARKEWKAKPQPITINGMQGWKAVEQNQIKKGMIVVLRDNNVFWYFQLLR